MVSEKREFLPIHGTKRKKKKEKEEKRETKKEGRSKRKQKKRHSEMNECQAQRTKVHAIHCQFNTQLYRCL